MISHLAMPTNLHPKKKEPTIDEYGIAIDQKVDLGFPSGTIWAGWNLGATMPEEFGDYYACGETKIKTEYSLSNYSHWIDKNEDGYLTANPVYCELILVLILVELITMLRDSSGRETGVFPPTKNLTNSSHFALGHGFATKTFMDIKSLG